MNILSWRVAFLYGVLFSFVFSVFNSLAVAQGVSDDVAALAALCSNNYYQDSHIPYYDNLARSFGNRVEAIRDSSDRSLAAAYRELKTAREKLFQLHAARLAVASGTPVKDAIDFMTLRWLSDPSARQDFTPEVADAFTGRLQKLQDLHTIQKLSEAPTTVLGDAWKKYSPPAFKMKNLETSPVKLEFGFVQSLGYGKIKNTSAIDLTNLIVVFRSETKTHGGRASLVYFVPRLGRSKSIRFAVYGRDWPVSASETDPKKFNSALTKRQLKISLDLLCDEGKFIGQKSQIRSGLSLRMDYIKSILVKGAVFRSKSGGELAIDRVSGTGLKTQNNNDQWLDGLN